MTKRRRRTAEEARARILDAAEKRLTEAGPAGLRLQDIAADVGVSHPAILHHFGSREGLVRAVVSRALTSLELDLVKALTGDAPPVAGEGVMLERVAQTLSERGHARLLAWLILSGYGDAMATPSAAENWKTIIAATQALRQSAGVVTTYEDTAFGVILASVALFGQAIAGPTVFRLAGLDAGPATERRFRRWLDSLLVAHMGPSPPKPPP